MKKLLVSFLSVGFISATCIFVSCKKKEDPAPTPIPTTTTTGGSTTGSTTPTTTSGTTSGSSSTTTSGTTSGSTSSGTTSGSTSSNTTTSGTTSGTTTSSSNSGTGTGSFSDGTISKNGLATVSKSGNAFGVVLYGANTSGTLPTVVIGIASNGSTGTFTDTNAPGTYGGITYSSATEDSYFSLYTGGICSVKLTTNNGSKLVGTYTFTAKNSAGTASKTVSGSFDLTF